VADSERAGGEVHVLPAQPEQFALPQPGGDRDVEPRPRSVGACVR
jgi:hypothetical protein